MDFKATLIKEIDVDVIFYKMESWSTAFQTSSFAYQPDIQLIGTPSVIIGLSSADYDVNISELALNHSRILVYRLYCLNAGVIQFEFFNNKTSIGFSTPTNIFCNSSSEKVGVFSLPSNTTNVVVHNRGYSSLMAAINDLIVLTDHLEQDLKDKGRAEGLVPRFADYILRKAVQSSTSSSYQKTAPSKFVLLLFTFILVFLCVSRVRQLMRERRGANHTVMVPNRAIEREMLRQTEIEHAELTPFDADKYSRAILKRVAGEDLGPWGEKK